ncbi:uncharacterized protein [Lolium perenne]|uniref:uncharacterized protein n=1 Tax=Lolium perenne TaxID=4522 RepID=UPI003A99C18D
MHVDPPVSGSNVTAGVYGKTPGVTRARLSRLVAARLPPNRPAAVAASPKSPAPSSIRRRHAPPLNPPPHVAVAASPKSPAPSPSIRRHRRRPRSIAIAIAVSLDPSPSSPAKASALAPPPNSHQNHPAAAPIAAAHARLSSPPTRCQPPQEPPQEQAARLSDLVFTAHSCRSSR